MNTRTDLSDKTVVLVSGWATDSRIFQPLQPALPGALTIDAAPSEFEAKLLALMEKKALGQVSIMGWSIGGYLAADFALKHPGRVDGLYLLGVRNKYPAQQIEHVRRMIKRNARAYLSKFYLECFSPDEGDAYRWFKETLMEDYLACFEAEGLLSGLDYLAQASLDPNKLAGVENVRFFHGSKDRIAPVEDVACLQSHLLQHEFVFIENAGHAVFLNRGFREKFSGSENSPRRADLPPLSLQNRGAGEDSESENSPRRVDSPPLSLKNRGVGEDSESENSPRRADSPPLSLKNRGGGEESELENSHRLVDSPPLSLQNRGVGEESESENSPRRVDLPPLSLQNRGVGEDSESENSPRRADLPPLSLKNRGAGTESKSTHALSPAESSPLYSLKRGDGGEFSPPDSSAISLQSRTTGKESESENSPRRVDSPPLSLQNRGAGTEPKSTHALSPAESSPLYSLKRGDGGEFSETGES